MVLYADSSILFYLRNRQGTEIAPRQQVVKVINGQPVAITDEDGNVKAKLTRQDSFADEGER